jgi:hypothetical protein
MAGAQGHPPIGWTASTAANHLGARALVAGYHSAPPPGRRRLMSSMAITSAAEAYDRQYRVWVERQGPQALDLDCV